MSGELVTGEQVSVIVTNLTREFAGQDLNVMQALALAEEAGEFVGAFRRWYGMARRHGPFSDVELELADVVITSHVVARILGIDLHDAVARKMEIVLKRGWRDG